MVLCPSHDDASLRGPTPHFGVICVGTGGLVFSIPDSCSTAILKGVALMGVVVERSLIMSRPQRSPS